MKKHQDQKNIEIKMFKIQKSTRTLFNVFSPAHNWFRQKSKWYYNWHLNPIQPAVHVGALLLTLSIAIMLCSNVLYTGASSPQAKDLAKAETKNTLDPSIKAYIEQAVATSTDVIVKEVSSRLAKSDKTLAKISKQIETNLTSSSTQEEISSETQDDLAKEETLTELTANIGKIPDSSVVDQLSQILAKTSSEATLEALKTEINSNLNLASDLLESVNDRLGDITDPESGSANDLLNKISNKLSNELAVSITNWATSFKVENFPEEFPDPNVSRAQEEIGKEQFNRSEDLIFWSARRDYSQTAYSGEITNPISGSVELLNLSVPSGHTYYLTGVSISTKNKLTTKINVYSSSSKSAVDRFYLNTGSTTIDYPSPIKLVTGGSYRWEIQGEKDTTDTTTINVFYIDFPWEE